MLQQHHADGREAQLLLVDIDDFKQINDSHGHAIGDDVLRAIAAVVRHAITGADHAGRFGGDELAVALRGDTVRAESVAASIREAVAQLRFPQAPALRCSVSLGAAAAGPGHHGLREWLEDADRALYRAKSARRKAPPDGQLPTLYGLVGPTG